MPLRYSSRPQDNSLWGFKGNSTFLEFPVVVDTVPPNVQVLSTTHNVVKGGTGLVIFRLSEEPAKVGLTVGDIFFPAYPEESAGDGVYLAYFAVAHDSAGDVVPILEAGDKAGNEVRRAVPTRIRDKAFKRSNINISDNFLRRKMPEFRVADPALSTNPVEAFLTVNREWRRRDHETLRGFTAKSNSSRLWSGAFLQMANTQNMSPYAVKRRYLHKGRRIDEQIHLGLDLASTAGASVPAANTGIVAMAGDNGIYGQTVVLDHGQGLFSLYSHLSGIVVSEGESVSRGQTIGTSGQTGLAGGDHLHFSVLVSGEFVNPLEWLDGRWIANNIENKLEIIAPGPEQ